MRAAKFNKEIFSIIFSSKRIQGKYIFVNNSDRKVIKNL